MTNNEKYKSELDGEKASDAFKQNTIAMLKQVRQQASGEPEQAKPKQKFFTLGRVVAWAATLVLLVGGALAMRTALAPAGGSAPMAEQATGAASMAAESAPMMAAESVAADNDMVVVASGTAPEGDEAEEGSRQVQVMPSPQAPLMAQEPWPSRLPYLMVGIVCLPAALVIGIVLICKVVRRKRNGEK